VPIDVNLWSSSEHALDYLRRADSIPHRVEGEATLLELLPAQASRILDLGSGAGRLISLVKSACPAASFVAVDFSSTMIQALRLNFGNDAAVSVIRHDLSNPLPELGSFDAVVSSFAIHHLHHQRKRELYAEIFRALASDGMFLNLEHVSSPTEFLHREFMEKLHILPEDEDPSNKLLNPETQLAWLREIGFSHVDCHWKWRELALLGGKKSATQAT
jgi:tRNA (cmo5U34)-methyltransferase